MDIFGQRRQKTRQMSARYSSDFSAVLQDIVRGGFKLRKALPCEESSGAVDNDETSELPPHVTGFRKDRSQLLDNANCDYVLRYQEKEFGFHEVFLTGQSNYFDCIINTDCEERTMRTIDLGDIEGVEPPHILKMLQYLYGKPLTSLKLTDVNALYILAKYFQIANLKNAIKEWTQGNITTATKVMGVQNCRALHQLVNFSELTINEMEFRFVGELIKLDYPELNERCGVALASTTVSWKDLLEYDFDVVKGFFSSSSFECNSLGGLGCEDQVIEAMIKYSNETSLDLERQTILASKIRLQGLSKEGIKIAKYWAAVDLEKLVDSLSERLFGRRSYQPRRFFEDDDW